MLAEYVHRHREWSERTFGPGLKTIGITKHIEKECQEIRQNPTDLSEWVDVMILAMDGYWRHGGDAARLQNDLDAKQAINFSRRWPTVTRDDKPTEHLR